MSLDFESSDGDRLVYPGISDFNAPTALSFGAWVKGESWSGANRDIFTRWRFASTQDKGWITIYSNGSNSFRAEWAYSGNSSEGVNFFTPSTGVWYYVLATWSTTYRNIWVATLGGAAAGGTALTTTRTSISSVAGTTDIVIGSQDDPGNFFDGQIAEAAIWTRDISFAGADLSDITALNAGANSTEIYPADLVFYNPLYNRVNLRDFIGGYTGSLAGTGGPDNGVDHPPVRPPFFQIPGRFKSAAAGATITVPASKNFNFAGIAPAVAAGASVAPPAGAYDFAGRVPVIGAGASVNVPAKNYDFSGQVPVVVSGGSVTVPVKDFSFAGQVPTIGAGAAVSVPLQDFSFAGQVPTITVGGVVINAPVQAYDFAGVVPTIASGVSILVTVKAYSFAGQVPGVAAGASIPVPVQTYAAAGQAPTIGGGASVAIPAAQGYAFAGLIPTLEIGGDGVTVVVPTQAYLFQGYRPVIAATPVEGGFGAFMRRRRRKQRFIKGKR